MKPTRHILLLAALLLGSLAASAHDIEVGGIYYNIKSTTDLTAEVTFKGNSYYSYSNEYSGSITIPATVPHDGVQYSVTSIGNYAFYGCSSLTDINIPKSVTSIGNSAFEDCSSLTDISIPENSQLTSIGSSAFSYCSKLSSITIPEGVTSIGSSAFAWCSSLTAVHISSIEAWCKITFNSNPLYYAHNLYLNGELVTNLVIPEGVTSIGSDAFYNCSSLTAITIPENSQLTSIGREAFYGCSSLTAITIPENSQLTSIGLGAFGGCSSLTTITIPEGVTSIGERAFYECSSLTSITIPEGVTSIGYAAFYYCKSLTTITIPENSQLTSIGREAFYGCSSLTSITIPEGVTSIGYAAFAWCSSLTAITLSEGVTSIGDTAFRGCTSLTAITIPESVTSIENQAFYDCSKLTAITIPEGVTSIGREAFYGCSSLTAIIVEEGNEVYDSRNGCNAIIETNSNTLIQGCSTTIIPEGVTSIGNHAFYGCSSLTDITIPEGVTSIGEGAFYYCKSLTTITLPEGVTSIGSSAFRDCSSLTTITCEAITPPTVGDSETFYNVNKSIPVYVPAGSVKAYKSAEGWSKFTNIVGVVVPVTHTTLSQSSATLLVEESLTLTATVAPDNATDKTLTWSSSNPSVATVDNMGKVTAIALGTATITATANDGSGVSAQCEVTVTSTAKVEIDGIWYNITSEPDKTAEVTFKGDSYDSYSNEYSGSITIPATVTHNGVAYSVTSIGDETFGYCRSLTAITIPEGVTSIGSMAFYGCSSLTAITIPEGVTSIGYGAFYFCYSLTAITIPEGVTSIGDAAFYGCTSLTSTTIPKSVTSIGNGAFYGCSGLTAITCEAITPPAVGNSDTFYNVNKSIPVYVPAGSVEAYKVALGWRGFTNIVGVSVPITHITLSQSSATLLVDESLTLTATVAPDKATDKTLTWSSSNPSVATVDDMGKVTAIAPGTATITATANDGSGVSAQCEVTVKVEIDGIWYNITSESDKTAKVTFKGDSYNSYSNEYSGSITLPATVTHNGVEYSVTSIGEHAFRGCSSLTAITIPEGVTSIGDYAFYNCSRLTAITIPEGVTSIGDFAFGGCSSLTDITLPEGVTSIGKYAFADCSRLTAITIPEGVTSIENGAFAGCSSLTAITCEAITPPTVNDSHTFYNVNKSIPVYVTAGSVEAYKVARGWSEFTNIVGVVVPVTHTTLSQSSATLLVDESLTLTAMVAPDNATDKTLTWSSSNPSVATVDDMGKVTAIAPGTATITATANDGSGVSAQCEVTVRLSTNKNYRIKNVSTGLYLQVSGNNTNMTLQSKAEGVEPTQVFQLEDAGEGMYYIKAADGDNNYYAHASSWNFNATNNAANKTPFTIALIDSETEVYTIHQSTSSYTGLAGSDASGVGSAIYCNKGVGNNGKWCFETLTEEENTAYFVALTAAARALLDAAIARAEEVVANRSEVLTAEEVAAINSAVQAAKDSKDDAVEEAELNALTNAVSEAVDAAVYVWSLDELNSNTSYAVATEDRGAWYAQSERLNSTVKVEEEQDIADTKQQFAFVKSPTTNACYLYSVGEEKFVKVEGDYTALTETPVHTISFLEGTRSTAFPWVVALNANGEQKQLGVSNGYDYGVITSWNNLNDMGNTVRIEKVAAFDASAALALIDALETSIEKTGIASQNSEIIFDLQGRRVEKPNKPGIYIVGGRKLVIK